MSAGAPIDCGDLRAQATTRSRRVFRVICSFEQQGVAAVFSYV